MRSILYDHATRTHGSDGVIEALSCFAMHITNALQVVVALGAKVQFKSYYSTVF